MARDTTLKIKMAYRSRVTSILEKPLLETGDVLRDNGRDLELTTSNNNASTSAQRHQRPPFGNAPPSTANACAVLCS